MKKMDWLDQQLLFLNENGLQISASKKNRVVTFFVNNSTIAVLADNIESFMLGLITGYRGSLLGENNAKK